MNRCHGFGLIFVLGGLAFSAGALAGPDSSGGGVYACSDAQGHKFTSDRPIPECIDREQKILNPSGTVKQTIGPVLTAQERAKQEAKAKQELDEHNRLLEERRRDRVLLARFPNRAAHDAERADALEQVSVVTKAAAGRLVELGKQRKKLDDEMEFYKKDPSKAPAYLQRQMEDNKQSTVAQKRFLLDQEEEVRRVNRRFDDELERLRPLWVAAGVQP
jgi:hypothetical protein